MERIYFDNNATTVPAPEVRAAMAPYLGEIFGNPSSGHRDGERARAGVEQAREQAAALLHCPADRLVFTSGGTEANSTAIWSAVAAHPEKRHIVASRVEHPSVLRPLAFLAERFGYEVELLPVADDGGLDLDLLRRALRQDTVLVSLMGANNETGVVWPLAAIAAICREHGVLFHCDAVQLCGKLPLNLHDAEVDYLSVAGHKLHGPKGVGLLYVRRTAPLVPMFLGGSQEAGRRAGTENVAGIVGFGQACELAARNLGRFEATTAPLRDRLEEFLLSGVPDVLVAGRTQPRLANTLNAAFAGCASAALVQELDERGIAVSAHSACHSGDVDPSHVLSAMAMPEEFLHGVVRFSFGLDNTAAELERLLGLLPEVVARLRRGLAL